MTNLTLNIFENSSDYFEYWNVIDKVKIKRGWLHLIHHGSGGYDIAWTFREKQTSCELISTFLTDQEILKNWRERSFCYKLVGRNSFRKNNIRDSQRKKCYEWERKTHVKKAKRFNQTEMTAFIHKIFKDEGITSVKIKYRSGGRTSYARGESELAFLPCHMNNMYAAHEVAHILVYAKHRVSVAGHGPEWVSEYMRLLVKYCDMDLTTLRSNARKFKVKYT